MTMLDAIALPAVLYRYFRPKLNELPALEHVRALLTERRIYFTRPDQCDDKDFDVNPPIRSLTTAERFAFVAKTASHRCRGLTAQSRRSTIERARQRAADPAFLRDVFQRYRRRVRILCLAPTPTVTRYWDEYASEGTGICVAFDFDALMNAGQDWCPFPVSYADELPAVAPVLRGVVSPGDYEPQFRTTYFTKLRRWEWQREWRALRMGETTEPQYYSLPDGAITGVYLGSNIDCTHRTAIVDWCSVDLPDVAVVQMRETDAGEIEFGETLRPRVGAQA